jgi:phage pi2 protein 07
MNTITQILITVLVGTASGAAGGYFSSKYTDKRKEQESQNRETKKFKKLMKEMPDLFREIKEDLSNEETKFIRELVLMPNERVAASLREDCLVYYENKHPSLKSKIDILENHGYVFDVTETSLPKYRLSEEFVALIHKYIQL